MKKFLSLISLCFLVSICSIAQNKNEFYFASKQNRDSLTKALKAQVNETIKLDFRDRYYLKFKGSFWAMELMLYRPLNYEKVIPTHIQKIVDAPADIQYSFLEMLYTLYAKKYIKPIENIWQNLKTNKAKALALEYLADASVFIKQDQNDKFFQSSHFKSFANRWSKKQSLLPTKNDCLHSSFFSNEDVLISFQSSNRNKPGYIMLRQANGKWKTDKTGKPIKFAQLARSISNLPYYLTNGNTPQGIFKILGVDTSTNDFIGPTTNLQMVMPFEENNELFFGKDTLYQTYYSNLLGNLSKYEGLQESFVAGSLGRSEIIAHGTTINPSYYTNKSYFPCTPSLGCLCSPEIWNNKGVLLKSDQQKWVSNFVLENQLPKWLVVINVRDL